MADQELIDDATTTVRSVHCRVQRIPKRQVRGKNWRLKCHIKLKGTCLKLLDMFKGLSE